MADGIEDFFKTLDDAFGQDIKNLKASIDRDAQAERNAKFQALDREVKNDIHRDWSGQEIKDESVFNEQFDQYSKEFLGKVNNPIARNVAENHLNKFKSDSIAHLRDTKQREASARDKRIELDNLNTEINHSIDTLKLGVNNDNQVVINATNQHLMELMDHGIANGYLTSNQKNNVINDILSHTTQKYIQDRVNHGQALDWKSLEEEHKKDDFFQKNKDRIQLYFEKAKQQQEFRTESELAIHKESARKTLADVSYGADSIALSKNIYRNIITPEQKAEAKELGRFAIKPYNEKLKMLDGITNEDEKKKYQNTLNYLKGVGGTLERGKVNGLVDLKPINFEDPQSLESRDQDVGYLKNIYGKNYLKYFTQPELNNIKEVVNYGEPEEIKNIINGINGHTEGIATLKRERDLGYFGHLAEFAGDPNNEKLVNDIISGRHLLRTKQVKINDFDGALYQELPLNITAKNKDGIDYDNFIRDSIKNIYANAHDKTTNVVDTDRLSESISSVISVVDNPFLNRIWAHLPFTSKHQIIAPKASMNFNDVKEWLDNISTNEIEGSYRDEDKQKIISQIKGGNLYLESFANGAYYLRRSDNRQYLMSGKNDNVILRYNYGRQQ